MDYYYFCCCCFVVIIMIMNFEKSELGVLICKCVSPAWLIGSVDTLRTYLCIVVLFTNLDTLGLYHEDHMELKISQNNVDNIPLWGHPTEADFKEML